MKAYVVALCCAVAAGLIGFAPSSDAKTRKECAAEWVANKAALQASGKSRRRFMSECRADTAAQKGAPKTGAAPTTLGKDQYANEADAKAHCADNPVVWVNLRSKVYHASSSKSYGKTKRGAYMCAKEAGAAGYRPPRSRKKT